MTNADPKMPSAEAEKVYADVRKALAKIVPEDELDGSCRACPSDPGGAICSSFLGDADSPGALCRRDFCGHAHLVHVG